MIRKTTGHFSEKRVLVLVLSVLILVCMRLSFYYIQKEWEKAERKEEWTSVKEEEIEMESAHV